MDEFKGVAPYESELFGVYQPLIGWRSKRITRRFSNRPQLNRAVIDLVKTKISPHTYPAKDVQASITYVEPQYGMSPGSVNTKKRLAVGSLVDSTFARSVLARVNEHDPKDDAVWDKVLSIPEIAKLSSSIKAKTYEEAQHESVVAGMLMFFVKNNMHSVLRDIFRPTGNNIDLPSIIDMQKFVDPLEKFDPKIDLDNVALSPMGIVHLFRQYFFEFDTFLGTPVEHVWISPGATVEMIEVSSRKTVTERYTENAFESVVKDEKSLTESDDISDAVSKDNQSSTKFGVSASVSGGANTGVYTVQASANVNYGFDSSEKRARETIHKQARQQTTKLSSEIKKNYKSTFKTTVDIQDTSSKRYVIQNPTGKLVNYEIRRKMRQVGVQMQDIGTYMCWQAYVDNPGDSLGVSKLVHIAEPADTSNIPQPTAPTLLQQVKTELNIQFQYENTTGHEEKDVVFVNGDDGETGLFSNNDKIVWKRGYHADPPDHGYTLDSNITLEPQHSNTCVAVAENVTNSGDYTVSLPQVNFDDQSAINIKVTLRWNPPDQTVLLEQYMKQQINYTREKERAAKEAYVKAAKERVTKASNVEPRSSDDLREEERTVVYRKLIGELLDVGANLNNSRARHVTSELIDSMFDTGKLLYFVAPEWWHPRLHSSSQGFANGIPDTDVVSWGGTSGNRQDNYWITDESKPAKLGSSLGWLLQLDGDNMRNAFLNAPWVKAVIPIRPGKERAALNWMTHASIEGTDGISNKYAFTSDEERNLIVSTLRGNNWNDPSDVQRYGHDFGADDVTIWDALTYLSVVVANKDDASNVKQQVTNGNDAVESLPTDVVYERGYYPLQGGFKARSEKPFEVFDQWIEILPTDQVAAVEVTYDPKTGKQKLSD